MQAPIIISLVSALISIISLLLCSYIILFRDHPRVLVENPVLMRVVTEKSDYHLFAITFVNKGNKDGGIKDVSVKVAKPKDKGYSVMVFPLKGCLAPVYLVANSSSEWKAHVLVVDNDSLKVPITQDIQFEVNYQLVSGKTSKIKNSMIKRMETIDELVEAFSKYTME